jgi:phosphotriesterase-related protein
MVESVLGPIDVTALGRTLMHEHIFTFHSDMSGDYPWSEEDEYIEGAIEKCRLLKEAGWETLVDLTVIGIGRKVARVARVARESGCNVIVATGLFFDTQMPLNLRYRSPGDGETFLEDLFVREVKEGIGDTGIRASLIKAVTDRPGLTPDVEIALRAVARAQLRTGVPISTHTDAFHETGLIQQRVFGQEGVDLTHVIIGHCGDTTDLNYLQRLMDAGSTIGMDRFGLGHYLRDGDRIKTVAALCRKGYASQMVLSHDANCGGDMFPRESLDNWRWGFIPQVVIPELLSLGVSTEDIDQMTIENPERIFGEAAVRASSLA